MTTLPSSSPATIDRPPRALASASERSLGAHLRACSAPRSLASWVRQGLEGLHGLTAPRLVSTWFALLLIATLLALAF